MLFHLDRNDIHAPLDRDGSRQPAYGLTTDARSPDRRSGWPLGLVPRDSCQLGVDVGEAVGGVGAMADPDRFGGALQGGVMGAVGALAGADVGDDAVEAALHVQWDEGGTVGVASGSADGDSSGIAGVIVVVGTAIHRAFGNGRQVHQSGGHHDLRIEADTASEKAPFPLTVALFGGSR